jgi:predicted ATPase/DNA-binding winged helix-turn-helix (wHTH) protein
MIKTDETDAERDTSFEFGEYRVDLNSYELYTGDTLVAVEPQVFALLGYLIQNSNRLVTKDELLDELWGHRYVSESALSTQIKSLRKAVGDDGQRQAVIQTVRGRGYQFVAPLHAITSTTSTPTSSQTSQLTHNLPRDRTPMFGRKLDVTHCRQLIETSRLVTILGIGGTGKTRLAAAVGREVARQYSDGVWFIDLIPLHSLDSLETAVADVLGMALKAGATRPQLIDALRQRDLLLIFDNCEHLRDPAANLLNDLLEYTEAPQFMATSRDPLGLIDEQRFFLNPLATHAASGHAPAVELFIATAARHGVRVTTDREADIERICTQLDGLPLAIELAAAQLRHLTLDDLDTRLHKRFEVLAGRQRSPSGRQSNLLGVLEDTWEMLTEKEQALLQQLATFPSSFTMTSVEELMNETPHHEVSNGISRLVDLGLIQRTSSTGLWWRVLETVRAFATDGLSETNKAMNAARHAGWCLHKLGRFPDDQLDNLSQAEWCLAHYADLVAAEQFFARSGELESAYAICAGTGLMVQLDDGARAKVKLESAERYLDATPSPYWQARLHGIAGLSAQANRLPVLLAHHNESYIRLARTLDDPDILANALLMQSLTTGFIDRDKALAQLEEMIELGRASGNQSLQQSGLCYRAWQLVMDRDYDGGRGLAEQLINDYLAKPSSIDNPAYNAVGIIVSCAVVDEAATAARWAAEFPNFPAATSFWGIQNLIACVEASSNNFPAAAKRCLDIKTRLNRAARDEFPDVLVTAILLSHRGGETSQAQRWLSTIRYSGVPIQMYHTIAIYRQLYAQLGCGEYSADNAPSLDTIRPDVTAWLTTLSAGET